MDQFKNILINLKKVLKVAAEGNKYFVIGYFLTSICGVSLIFLLYFLYKLLIDHITKNLSITIPLIVFLLLGAYLVFEYLSRFVFFLISRYFFSELIRYRFQFSLNYKFMDKLGSLDFANLENGKIRNLIAKVEDSYHLRLPLLLEVSNYIVYNLGALILSLIIAFKYNIFYFLLLAGASTPLYILRARYGNITWSIHSSKASKINLLWYLKSIFTNFQTLPEIKIYGLKNHLLGKTKEMQEEILEDYKKVIKKYTLYSSLLSMFIPIVLFFIMKDIVYKISLHRYSLGDFTFLMSSLFTFSQEISSLSLNIGSLFENNLYANDYFKLLEIKNKTKNSLNPHRFHDIVPHKIEFKNVTFYYPGSKTPSLKNVNLTINKGENVAIVGRNGAGKSTLIKLMLRFYDPTEGKILIDGIDLKKIDSKNWYRHLGILFQDFAKYNFTLKENILFGELTREYTNNAIIESLRLAQGGDIPANLPKGVDNILGRWFEEGKEISGGQWQKITIARALYRQAPMLILDEPTSSIDPESEYEIFLNLKKVYQNKSLIFISHRFSTVRMADKIYLVDGGKIIEEGDHEKLLSNNNLYARYFNLQKKGYE